MRQEYFNFQLPRILRSLKECADEIDLGTQYHLSRYAFLFESIILNDGSTISPTGGIEDGELQIFVFKNSRTNPTLIGPGLKPIMESIDNRQDFKVYMQNYAIATNRPTGPRREGPWEEGFVRLPVCVFLREYLLNNRSLSTRRLHLYLVTMPPMAMLGYLTPSLGGPRLIKMEGTVPRQTVVRRMVLRRKRLIHQPLQKPCNSILIVAARRSEYPSRSK